MIFEQVDTYLHVFGKKLGLDVDVWYISNHHSERICLFIV